jgi:hypothetical protein
VVGSEVFGKRKEMKLGEFLDFRQRSDQPLWIGLILGTKHDTSGAFLLRGAFRSDGRLIVECVEERLSR